MNDSKTTWKRCSAAILAILTFFLVPWQSHSQPATAGPATGEPLPDVHLESSGTQAIIIELRTPAWEAGLQEVGAFQLDEIRVPGFSYTSEPDAPRLPVKFVALGIPPGAQPQLEILEADGPRVEASYRLAANSSPASSFDSEIPLSLAALTGPPKPQLKPAKGDKLYPAELAQIIEVGRLRSQPFVQIRLNPFQYHPAKQELRVYKRLRVAVKLNVPGSEIKSAWVDEGPFEPILRSLLLNYAEAKGWRVPPAVLAQTDLQSFYTGIRFRVEVRQAGVYQLNRNMLLTPDQPIYDFPLHTFQLFEDFNLSPQSEVPLEIVDEDGDDRLDFEDVIRFYGREPDDDEQRYTDRRAYWLVAGREAGKRMATRSGSPGAGTIAPDFPATVHVEENHQYWSDLPALGGSDTHWYWSYLVQVDPNSPLVRDYTVSTPGRSSSSHNVTLRVKVVGYSSKPEVDPDHRTKVYLNSSPVASVTWDGQAGMVIKGDDTSSNLNSGANTVRLRLDLLPTVNADALFVDWFEIDYRRSFQAQSNRLTFTRPASYSQYQITGFSSSYLGVYDITDPRNPVRLTDLQTPAAGTLRFGDANSSANRYIALVLQPPAILTPDKVERVGPGDDLRSSANAADYLIITHADFTAAAKRLADYRAGDFTTKVVQVQDVFNQFGNGVLDPEAIHDFLAHAVDRWSLRPRYVLLIGDGTYDYRDYLGTSRQNYVPPYQAMVDPWLGETADENYYAAVVGADIMPDLFVGRLAVNSLSEANAVIDKIIRFEAAATAQSVPARALLVADDYEPTRNAGNFPRLADAIAGEILPDSYSVQKVYFGETHSTVSSVKAAIISNINQGQQFVNYIGHSSIGQWGDGDGFFTSSDVDSLGNGDKFPVVLGMTCLEGSFQDVAQDAVAERMVRVANKGAVASWSATGLGVATGHDELNREFFNALFQHGVGRLGPAAVTAKVELYKTGSNLDLIHTFVLLGDPATNIGIQAACKADVTGNGQVDVEDLAQLSLYWRQYYPAYDQNGDGFINIVDFMMVAANWNVPCGG